VFSIGHDVNTIPSLIRTKLSKISQFFYSSVTIFYYTHKTLTHDGIKRNCNANFKNNNYNKLNRLRKFIQWIWCMWGCADRGLTRIQVYLCVGERSKNCCKLLPRWFYNKYLFEMCDVVLLNVYLSISHSSLGASTTVSQRNLINV
jgi:hypothetical protein